MKTSQPQQAAAFRALHSEGPVLVLPNAWDAGSARLIEACGARAIATSSASMAWSHGYADGEAMPLEVVLRTVQEIVRVVKVPVSADFEAGYATSPEDVGRNLRALLDVGAIGVNLEDGTGPVELLAKKIAAARRAASEAGVALFVNARTDVYLAALVPPEQRLEETLSRARVYREAGADGLFAAGITHPTEIATLAAGCGLPLNVLARAGMPPVSALGQLGVRRVSAGNTTASVGLGTLRATCAAMLERGDLSRLFEGRVEYAEMNALFR